VCENSFISEDYPSNENNLRHEVQTAKEAAEDVTSDKCARDLNRKKKTKSYRLGCYDFSYYTQCTFSWTRSRNSLLCTLLAFQIIVLTKSNVLHWIFKLILTSKFC